MTQVKDTVRFSQLLQRRVRELRTERGWTQDELAWRASQHHGLDWDRATVRHVEDGSRSVGDDFPVLLLLFEVGLEELFSAPGPRVILGGYVLNKPSRLLEVYRDGTATAKLQRKAEAGARTAEEKAAKGLGVSVQRVQTMAQLLWTRPLTDEREWRLVKQIKGHEANPRARQAIRGHITRQLLDELREGLKDMEGRWDTDGEGEEK